jgi:hypothetical protein
MQRGNLQLAASRFCYHGLTKLCMLSSVGELYHSACYSRTSSARPALDTGLTDDRTDSLPCSSYIDGPEHTLLLGLDKVPFPKE